ncbi:MAG: polysaccharide biosynthesis/export family protein [Thermodesulfobacteriota bacterium]
MSSHANTTLLRRALAALLITAAFACGLGLPLPGTAAETGSAGEIEPPPSYRIGPGDVLSIMVWKNDDLSRVAPVLPDGRISLPLLGEMLVAGRTVSELQRELTDKWGEYVADPVVTVSVSQVNSFLVYVIGKVNAPGRFQLTGYTSVLQALATASGLNPFARRDDIKIFRRQGDETVIHPFNLEEVEKGVDLAQNMLLMPGDVIVVP